MQGTQITLQAKYREKLLFTYIILWNTQQGDEGSIFMGFMMFYS